MLTYKKHKDIPVEYRRAILDETLQKRIAKVPLALCNEIIASILDEDSVNESLMEFQVESMKSGKHAAVNVNGRKAALVQLDRILEYGEHDGKDVFIAVRQANKLIAGFANGDWITIPPKDALRRVRRNHADL